MTRAQISQLQLAQDLEAFGPGGVRVLMSRTAPPSIMME